MRIPQGPSLPGDELRNLLESNPFPFLEECAREYGPAFTLDVGSRGSGDGRSNGLWHLVWGREYNNHLGALDPQAALSGAGHNLTVGSILPENSIFSQDGNSRDWVESLHKALGSNNESNFAFFAHCIERQVRLKKQALQKPSSESAFEFCKSICFGVSFDTVFGGFENPSDLTRLGLSDELERLRKLLLAPTSGDPRVDHSLRHFVKCRELIKSEFLRRKRQASEFGVDSLGDNFFDTLVRFQLIGFKLEDDQIIDNIFINWIKGARAMAAMTNWSLAYICTHETRSVETRESCDRLLRSPNWREAPVATLAREQHLNSFVKEMYRLVSLRAIISARLLVNHCELGDYSLPPGSIVASVSHLTHRNPAVYAEPNEFLPHRFIDKAISPGDWTPFGVSARQCMFARINSGILAYTVAQILHHFDISKDTISLHPEYTNLAFHPNLANKIDVRAKNTANGQAANSNSPIEV